MTHFEHYRPFSFVIKNFPNEKFNEIVSFSQLCKTNQNENELVIGLKAILKYHILIVSV